MWNKWEKIFLVFVYLLLYGGVFLLILSVLIENLIAEQRYLLIFLFFVPTLIYSLIWFLIGRDKVKIEEKVKAISHLPQYYTPISSLTPAQVGTILDERVDLNDMIAEIFELARLGFLDVSVKEDIYYFEKTNKKGAENLKDYQKYILNDFFISNSTPHTYFKDKMSDFFNNFKTLVYQNVQDEGYFFSNPNKTRSWWKLIPYIVFLFSLVISELYTSEVNWPLYLGISFVFPLIISNFMPKKTHLGSELKKQIKQLKKHLEKGQWRHEIYEKNIHIDDMLPTAISLGITNKTTRLFYGLFYKKSHPGYMKFLLGLSDDKHTFGYDPIKRK